MRSMSIVWLLALWLGAMPAAVAQDKVAGGTDLQALKTAADADKKALVASTLALTDAEAKKFWPVYSTYQLKLATLNRRQARVVEDLVGRDKPMTDALAKTVVAEFITIDDEQARTQRAYRNRLLRVLPATKVARYLQLEGKLRAIREYEIAGAMPLIR